MDSAGVRVQEEVKVDETEGCPECGGEVVATEGEETCEGCGLVVNEDLLDRGPPSVFSDERSGPPRTERRHDRGLGTASLGYFDVNGDHVQTPRLSRLRVQEQRAHYASKRERNLAHAHGEISRIVAALGQGESIAEQASRLVRTAQEADLFIGIGIEVMSAACVLATLRLNRRPFAARDLAPVARCDVDAIQMAYKKLNWELELPTPPPTVASQVPKIATGVSAPNRFQSAALAKAHQLDDSGALAGRRPSILAAACLYAVARDHEANWGKLTIASIAAEAGCSDGGLRQAYLALREVER